MKHWHVEPQKDGFDGLKHGDKYGRREYNLIPNLNIRIHNIDEV
jgi:hypothetical protein